MELCNTAYQRECLTPKRKAVGSNPAEDAKVNVAKNKKRLIVLATFILYKDRRDLKATVPSGAR